VPTDVDEFKDRAVTVHFAVDWVARTIAYRIGRMLFAKTEDETV